ncbi:MAG: hypothetical protein KF861_09755, partial [Planctomycetaceae bacterium]|nr:hypothetical protein [Planctomycetaceae bacterium]
VFDNEINGGRQVPCETPEAAEFDKISRKRQFSQIIRSLSTVHRVDRLARRRLVLLEFFENDVSDELTSKSPNRN